MLLTAVFICTATLLFSGCGSDDDAAGPTQTHAQTPKTAQRSISVDPKVRATLGEKVTNTLLNAKTITMRSIMPMGLEFYEAPKGTEAEKAEYKRLSKLESFLGRPVLGKLDLSSTECVDVMTAVFKGMAEEDDGWRAGCFLPRHGITAEVGDNRVDLLICFQCNYVYVYLNGENVMADILPSKSPGPVLNAVLDKHGIERDKE